MKQSTTLKLLIAEDELVLAHAIAKMLNSAGYLNIVIESRFEQAISAILNDNIDIALLDINLGKGDEGFELARVCADQEIPFIYTSSYSDKHTLDRAVSTNPGAYLIKPVSEGSLYATLQILLEQNKRDTDHMVLEFKDGIEWIKLPLRKVLYLKSENIYVNIITEDHTYLYRGSLQSLLDKVAGNGLVQTHRAYAVNPVHVSRIATSYVVINGAEVPVSRNYRSNMNKV
jgi:DNA-binding LytR/AlgR family response regulator